MYFTMHGRESWRHLSRRMLLPCKCPSVLDPLMMPASTIQHGSLSSVLGHHTSQDAMQVAICSQHFNRSDLQQTMQYGSLPSTQETYSALDAITTKTQSDVTKGGEGYLRDRYSFFTNNQIELIAFICLVYIMAKSEFMYSSWQVMYNFLLPISRRFFLPHESYHQE